MNFNKLIQIKDNNIVTTSLDVAETFDKKHKDVMKAIKNLMAQNCAMKSMFALGTHKVRGRDFPMYYMNRDGFTFVVMGFTGAKADKFKLEYINAFNAMEHEIKVANAKFNSILEAPKSRLFAMLSDQSKELEQAKPKANYYDTQMKNPGLMTTGVVAQDYGLTARKLNQILKGLKVEYKQGRTWKLYKNYKGKGYADYQDHAYNGNKGVNCQLKWTQKGKAMIHQLLDEQGYKSDTQTNLLDDGKDDK